MLVEAKDEPSREKIRTAIGQIIDSRRPSSDLEQLLGSVGVSVVWEADGRFADNTDRATLTS